MNKEKSHKKTICSRCKLPFIQEDWEDTICRECRGELGLQSYEENLYDNSQEEGVIK